jgi:hypothetical protein
MACHSISRETLLMFAVWSLLAVAAEHACGNTYIGGNYR